MAFLIVIISSNYFSSSRKKYLISNYYSVWKTFLSQYRSDCFVINIIHRGITNRLCYMKSTPSDTVARSWELTAFSTVNYRVSRTNTPDCGREVVKGVPRGSWSFEACQTNSNTKLAGTHQRLSSATKFSIVTLHGVWFADN